MESKQKYIQDNYYYEVDDWFVDKLKSYPRKIELKSHLWSITILISYLTNEGELKELEESAPNLKVLSFEVEYLKEPDQPPIFLDIEPIDVDEYLDYILDKYTKLKSNAKDTAIEPQVVQTLTNIIEEYLNVNLHDPQESKRMLQVE